jgi:cell division protein ZapA (FtsZ GTPase activity inhibitor)
MSEKRSSVKVTIVGQELTIRSDATPEHTRRVAEYVDKTIRSVMNSGAVVESSRAAFLAALQITPELYRARAAKEQLDQSLRGLSDDVRRMLPPAKRTAPSSA